MDNTNPYVGPGNVAQGGKDWLASLPIRGMFTQISDTPSDNPPKFVGPTDSLSAALAAAVPGDRIVVDPANLTTVSGHLVLPSGTAEAWITIEPLNLASLPDEYSRISPGESLPKIVLTSQSASITGGQFVRLIGFEITRPVGTGVVYNLINPSAGVTQPAQAHDLIFDRIYCHGTDIDETNRGLILNNVYNVAVINSHFDEFYCFGVVGKCGDSQCISGGGSTLPDGNFKIVNNFLEAAGENILFGGSSGTVALTDVTIAYNDISKRMSWNPKDPSYAPKLGYDGLLHPWIVKNLIEIKNGTRVLIEGNRMQNVWGGFTQAGAAILLTAKNAGTNGCPACQDLDIVVRYNWISYAAQAFQVAYARSDAGYFPADAGFFSIHDNLVDHLQYATCFQGTSFLNNLGGHGPNGALHDVSIDHNTFLLDVPGAWISPLESTLASEANGFLNVGTAPPGVIPSNFNLNFTNNLVDDVGNFGVYSTGGGATNCFSVYQGKPLTQLFQTCWPGGEFIGNQLMQVTPWKGWGLPWPPGNFYNLVNPGSGANQSLIDAAMAKRQ